jgi:molecular chaperone DnaJ
MRPAACDKCQGTGAKAGTSPRKCPTCGGGGRKVVTERRGTISFQHISSCPDCGGRGEHIDVPCPECGGRGKTTREELVSVRIPPGVEDGAALRVPGRGMPGSRPGTAPGDLFVVLRTTPDPRFERRGRDLYRIEMIDVVDAALGVEIQTPTLNGFFAIQAPPGAQPGTILRLREKGLPSFGGGNPGDLYVRLQVHVPESLSQEQRKLFERLRELKIGENLPTNCRAP